MNVRRLHSVLRFDDWCIPDPTNERLDAAMYRCRHERQHLTDDDMCLILEAAQAYRFLTTYALGQECCVEKLRTVWRALRHLEQAEERGR